MTRPLLALLAALVASGCASSELRALRNDLDRSTPELRIEEGRSFSFGFFSLGAARTALTIVGDDEDTAFVRAALSGARRVQFAHYDVSGSFDPTDVAIPERLARYLDDGWTPVVSVRDEGRRVWILANDHRDRVDELLLVTLSTDELVLAKVRGDLREIVRVGLAEERRSDERAAADASDRLATEGDTGDDV